MSAIKERIYGAVTVMSDEDADMVWDMITQIIPSRSWDEVPSVAPDEWDRQMLDEIASNPDCHEFMTEQEMLKALHS
jgi:hypothetical protein